MRKTSKYGLVLAMILTFTFGSSITVSAKPIDSGFNAMGFQESSVKWQSNSGIFWDFIIRDEFTSDIDYLYVYGWDESTMTLIASQNFDIPIESGINFKKGVATFTSSVIDVKFYFEKNTENFTTNGTRRDGDLNIIFRGFATVTGTVIIDNVTYILDGTFGEGHQIYIEEYHSITK